MNAFVVPIHPKYIEVYVQLHTNISGPVLFKTLLHNYINIQFQNTFVIKILCCLFLHKISLLNATSITIYWLNQPNKVYSVTDKQDYKYII